MRTFDKGLNETIINKISDLKNEHEDMRTIRLKAYHFFESRPNPKWIEEMPKIDFDDFVYYSGSNDEVKNSWEDIPKKIKDTFKNLGIIEAEAKYLSGVSTQYDSEVVYHKHQEELDKLGVIYCDTNTAYSKYHDLFMKYFNRLVPYTDNKYAALNTAVWSGGTFIYVPKGVKLSKPLQSYFRINEQSLGQFERTLIILEDDASLHYVEGCTAPIYSSDNLHAAVVEIYVGKNSQMKYTTIQNWSDNVLNYVTKRALVQENASMTWIDGNIGSKHNIKYPCSVLAGNGASGNCISIAVANENIIQDTGAKMIHLASNTKSNIISKTIGYKNSINIFRGLVDIRKQATNSFCNVQCDSLLLDANVISKTIPYEKLSNNSSTIEHEATVSKISDYQINYLMSRGLNLKEAKHLIVLGFIDVFQKELPMEYAVELNRLLKMEMES